MAIGHVNGQADRVSAWHREAMGFALPFTGRGGVEVTQYATKPPPGLTGHWDAGFVQLFQALQRGPTDIDRPYIQSWVIYVCLRAQSRALSSMPLKVWRDDTDDAEEVTDPDIVRLLKRPNPLMPGRMFVEIANTMRAHDGDVFLVKCDKQNRPIARPSQFPERLWPVRGAHIHAVQDANSFEPTGWQYVLAESMVYEPWQVVQVRSPNPYLTIRGLGEVQIALRMANQDYRADRMTDALIESGGVPSCVFASAEPLSGGQVKDAKEQLKARITSGEPLVLGEGLEPKPVAFTPVEMAFMEGKTWNRDATMAVFGMGPTQLGITDDVNRANGEVADRAVYQNHILPLADHTSDQLSLGLFDGVPGREDFVIGFDSSNVPALRENRDQQVMRAKTWFDMGLTVEAAARLEGIEDEITEADKKPPEPKPAFPGFGPNDLRAPRGQTLAMEPERAAEWHAYAASVAKPERKLTSEIERIQGDYVRAVLTRLEEIAASGPILHATPGTKGDVEAIANELAAMFPEPQAFVQRMRQSLAETLAEVFDVQAETMARRLGKAAASFARDDALAASFLASKEIHVAEGTMSTLAQAVRQRVAGIISEGGYTPQSIASGIRETLTKLRDAGELVIDQNLPARALTIARTETGAVANFARFGEAKAQGQTHHQWITSRDGHVRESHQRLDGDVVAIGTPFENGQLYPLDPNNGGAAESANCRCLAIPVDPSEAA